MEKTPYVTVLMPCYNDAAYITKAIESLLTQSRPPEAIIVLDDASTDDSWHILQQLDAQHPTLLIARNAQNIGTVKTRNKLFDLVPSNTTYVALLDSDDRALPSRLKAQVKYLEEHPFVTGINSDIEIINHQGEVIGTKSHKLSKDIRRSAIKWNPFAQSAMMLRWSEWQKVGKYDEALKRGEDYDMWLRLLSKGHLIDIIHTPLTQFRVHEGQGKWKQSQLSMREYARVRARFLFKPGFFSLKALGITCLYYFASLLPSSFVVWCYTHLYVKR